MPDYRDEEETPRQLYKRALDGLQPADEIGVEALLTSTHSALGGSCDELSFRAALVRLAALVKTCGEQVPERLDIYLTRVLKLTSPEGSNEETRWQSLLSAAFGTLFIGSIDVSSEPNTDDEALREYARYFSLPADEHFDGIDFPDLSAFSVYGGPALRS